MRRKYFLPASCLFALLAFYYVFASETLSAKDQSEWLKIRSANFELYTNANENRGRDLVRYFEQIRGFFLRASPNPRPRSKPIRLVGFRSEKEYSTYNHSKYAAAYYLSAPDADYIVMGKLQTDHQEIAVHEFIHLLVDETGARFPPWLNEGLAELYSTLTPVGKQVRVGDLKPGRVQLLSQTKWLELDTLLNIDHQAAHNQERKDAGIFYSQSWVLVHMLQLSPEYNGRFQDLMLALARGVPSSEVFATVYGKSIAEIEKDLRGYLNGGRVFASTIDIPLDKSADEPLVEPASELESGLVLAKLLSHIQKEQEALQMYQSLAESNPTDAQIPEELGYLALYSENHDLARRRFARAAELGGANAQMYYDYAHLLRRANAESEEVMSALRTAVKLRPDYDEAHRFLASLYMQKRSYGAAYYSLAQVKNVANRKDAHWLYYSMAHAQLELGGFDNAIQFANKALEFADSPDETSEVHNIIKVVGWRREAESSTQTSSTEPPQPPPVIENSAPTPEPREHISGELVEFECAGKSAVLHVLVDGARRKFTISDPGGIEIQGGSGALNFTCGPQDNLPIRVGFDKVHQAVLSIDLQ